MESLTTSCVCAATVFQLPSCGDALVCMQAPAMMRHACTDGPCSKDAQPPRLADYTTATMKSGRTRSTSIDLKQSAFLPHDSSCGYLRATFAKGTYLRPCSPTQSLALPMPRGLPPHPVGFVQGPRASLEALVHFPFNAVHWVDHFSAVNGSAGVAFKVKQARDTDRNVRRVG